MFKHTLFVFSYVSGRSAPLDVISKLSAPKKCGQISMPLVFAKIVSEKFVIAEERVQLGVKYKLLNFYHSRLFLM